MQLWPESVGMEGAFSALGESGVAPPPLGFLPHQKSVSLCEKLMEMRVAVICGGKSTPDPEQTWWGTSPGGLRCPRGGLGLPRLTWARRPGPSPPPPELHPPTPAHTVPSFPGPVRPKTALSPEASVCSC